MRGQNCSRWAALVIALLLATSHAVADEFGAIRRDLQRVLPEHEFERSIATPPQILRGESNRGTVVYRERVNGVVMIASEDGIGTGALVSAGGDVVTNEHVVRKAHRQSGAEWVAVWFKPPSSSMKLDRDRLILARVIAKDRRRDLAIIRLVPPVPSTATVIPLAPGLPEVGQDVFAIGHPARLFWSFTQGIVSQVRPNHEWTYEDGLPRTATAIQTQTPIVFGSSGSPLLNEEGKIIGVIAASAMGTQGFNFAIAVDHVRDLLRQ